MGILSPYSVALHAQRTHLLVAERHRVVAGVAARGPVRGDEQSRVRDRRELRAELRPARQGRVSIGRTVSAARSMRHCPPRYWHPPTTARQPHKPSVHRPTGTVTEPLRSRALLLLFRPPSLSLLEIFINLTLASRGIVMPHTSPPSRSIAFTSASVSYTAARMRASTCTLAAPPGQAPAGGGATCPAARSASCQKSA